MNINAVIQPAGFVLPVSLQLFDMLMAEAGEIPASKHRVTAVTLNFRERIRPSAISRRGAGLPRTAPQSLNPERRCRCCHRTRSPDRMRSVLCQRMTVSLLRMTSIPTFGWQYAMLKVSLSGGSGTLSPEPGRVLTTICNAMA